MTFNSEVLTLEVDNHVATLWLDREEARNAMGSALWRGLPEAAAAVAGDPAIRALVIAAKGPHFTVGIDLKEFGGFFAGAESGASAPSTAVANATSYQMVRRMQDSVTSIAKLSVPVIAAVHGYCIGGGVDLITACDIRLCSSDASFRCERRRWRSSRTWAPCSDSPNRRCGPRRRTRLHRKDIDASRALSIGLVNSVLGPGPQSVLNAAHELAARSPPTRP